MVDDDVTKIRDSREWLGKSFQQVSAHAFPKTHRAQFVEFDAWIQWDFGIFYVLFSMQEVYLWSFYVFLVNLFGNQNKTSENLLIRQL